MQVLLDPIPSRHFLTQVLLIGVGRHVDLRVGSVAGRSNAVSWWIKRRGLTDGSIAWYTVFLSVSEAPGDRHSVESKSLGMVSGLYCRSIFFFSYMDRRLSTSHEQARGKVPRARRRSPDAARVSLPTYLSTIEYETNSASYSLFKQAQLMTNLRLHTWTHRMRLIQHE